MHHRRLSARTRYKWGCEVEEKEAFWNEMEDVVMSVPGDDLLKRILMRMWEKGIKAMRKSWKVWAEGKECRSTKSGAFS